METAPPQLICDPEWGERRCSLNSLPNYGRSGLRPSLVQGLRPRNAPLQNHRAPTLSAQSSSAAPPTWPPPTEYAIR